MSIDQLHRPDTDVLRDAIDRELRRRDAATTYRMGRPTLLYRDTVTAQFDDQVRVIGGAEVRLPVVVPADIGKTLFVNNVDTNNPTTVRAAPRNTINQSTTMTVGPKTITAFVVNATGSWYSTVAEAATISGGAAGPLLWQWNKTDLTQFGTENVGGALAGFTKTVTTQYGVPCLEIALSGTGIGLAPSSMAALPIADWIPSTADYRIEVEWIKRVGSVAGAGAGASIGVLGRWSASTGAGDGYAAYMVANAYGIDSLTGVSSTSIAQTLSHYQPSQVGNAGIEGVILDLEVKGQTVLVSRYPRVAVEVDSGAAHTAAGQVALLVYGPGGSGNSWIFDIFRMEVWGIT